MNNNNADDNANLYQGLNEVYAIGRYFCGIPLYGWYVFTIQEFEEGVIQGTLLTPPIEISGPFETAQDAFSSIEEYLESDV